VELGPNRLDDVDWSRLDTCRVIEVATIEFAPPTQRESGPVPVSAPRRPGDFIVL